MLHVLAEAYLHRLDPFAIHLTGSFGIRWYGLSYAAGFVIAWLIIRWMAATDRSPLSVADVADLMFYTIAGVLVGGRLGYALFYDPALLVGFSSKFPFWDLLAIGRGGMASHGGIVGVILACIVFAVRRGIPRNHLLDLGSYVCAPGLFLGRLANFVNGELWGRPLPASMRDDPPWWSIKYPAEVLTWRPDVPADAARLAELETLRGSIGGDATFLQNVVDAAVAGNEVVIATLRPLLTAFYPSQIIQAVTDGPLLIGLLSLVWLKPRRPGVVGSWFLLGYGVMRLVTEQVRQPDEGVAMLLGLTRGQVLSLLMVVAGLIALPIVARRKVEPIGGLLRPAGA